MTSKHRILLAQIICVVLMFTTIYSAFGFIRFYDGSAFVYWALPTDNTIRYSIHIAGSDNIPDRSEDLAIRMAFESWSQVSTSRINFVEDLGNRHISDPNNRSVHSIIFDETNSTELFTRNSGIIAITVVQTVSGQITDADVIFNGRDHEFSTDGTPWTFDVQSIATHEIGHFLGLNHSGIRNATMYPFTGPNEYHLRSLSQDDIAGVAHLYPQGPDSNTISGTILGEGNALLKGVHVVAVSALDGRVEAAALTDEKGLFTLSGLTSRSYYVYAEPLDGPVTTSEINIPSINTNFSTYFYGGNNSPRVITPNPQREADLLMPPAHTMNLLQVSPNQVNAGQTYEIFFKADGVSFPQAQLTFSNPDITLTSAILPTLPPGRYKVNINVGAQVQNGMYNLMIKKSQDISILTGGMEVVSPAPSISNVSPSMGSQAGGDTIALQGQNFQSGARVIFGDQPCSTVNFVNSSTLSVVSPAYASEGQVKITVINPDGQFALEPNGFNYIAGLPAITSLTPIEGATCGGTRVTITGKNFLSGATVAFGGVTGTLISLTATQIICETPLGSAGSVDVKVTNPGTLSATLSAGFSYVNPSLTKIQPNLGNIQGGTLVALTGKGFDSKGQIEVSFGTQKGTSVTVQSEQAISCYAPASLTDGPVDVKVTNTRDGNSVLISGGYTYVTSLDPQITSISPSSGPNTGGTEVTLLGSNFENQAKVYIGGNLAQIKTIESSKIVILTPSGLVGSRDVVVENTSGQQALIINGFTYQSPVTPATQTSSGGGGGCILTHQDSSPQNILGNFLPLLLLLLGIILWRRKRENYLDKKKKNPIIL